MKRIQRAAFVSFLSFAAIGLAACSERSRDALEDDLDRAGDKIEDAADDVGDEIEDAFDD